MINNKTNHQFAFIFLILISTYWYLSVLSSCDLPTDPGPMPKTLIKTEYEPKLNVFGVLRTDGIKGSSFIHVEKTLSTREMYETGEIFDTTAVVRVTDSQTGDIFPFEMIEDTTHRGYYYNADFLPESGHCYVLEIQSEILPTLTAETVVPVQPEIVPQSLTVAGSDLQFRLRTTVDTYQYNCYLFFADDLIEKQISNSQDGTASVSFNFSTKSGAATRLMIIGYDRNLTEYLNSSPSFIPQTFHEMVITVENGYGCFGSLAMTTIQF